MTKNSKKKKTQRKVTPSSKNDLKQEGTVGFNPPTTTSTASTKMTLQQEGTEGCKKCSLFLTPQRAKKTGDLPTLKVLEPAPPSENEQISLEMLLDSPFFWKLNMHVELFVATQTKIHEDSAYKKFKTDMDDTAGDGKCELWGSKLGWMDVLGDDIAKLMITIYKTKNGVEVEELNEKYETDSVTDLLTVIRNRKTHFAKICDDEKEKLKWFKKVNGKWTFDNQLYAECWNREFPKLPLFLWLHSHFVRLQEGSTYSDLKKFYHVKLPAFSVETFTKFWNISEQFSIGLDYQFKQAKQGELAARYSMNGDPETLHLEFRPLADELVQRLTFGSSAMGIEISNASIICKWYGKQNETMDFKRTELAQATAKGTDSTNFNVVISTSVNRSMVKDMVLLQCEQGMCTRKRLIVFLSSAEFAKQKVIEEIDELVYSINETLKSKNYGSTFSDTPVSWEELGKKLQNWVEDNGIVKIQGKDVKLKDVLVVSQNSRESVLEILKGKVLNSLLKKEIPDIFPKLKNFSVPTVYIPRELRRRIKFSAEMINQVRNNSSQSADVIVVNNISKESVQKMLDCTIPEKNFIKKNIKSESSYSISGDHKLVLLEEDLQDSKKICPLTNSPTPIHHFRFIYEDTFEWLGSFGSTLSLQNEYGDFLTESQMLTESLFLNESKEKMKFIADKPGSGKSVLLKSLGEKVLKFDNRFVILLSMFTILLKMGEEKITKDSITNAIAALVSATEYEKLFIKYWLLYEENEAETARLQLELILDGLDEVKGKDNDYALKVLKVIQKEFLRLRVVVVLRDHMLPSLVTEFSSVADYKLEPFNEQTQIDYLRTHWCSKLNETVSKLRLVSFDKFARKCVQAPIPQGDDYMKGTPLMCWILAEIHKEQALLGTFNQSEIISPFQAIINEKLKTFFKNNGFVGETSGLISSSIFNSARDEMERFHTYFATQLIFGVDVANTLRSLLLVTDSNMDEVNDILLNQDFIYSLEPLTFIHRRFAEHFVVLFVLKAITGKYLHIPPNDPNVEKLFSNYILATDNSKYRGRFKYPELVEILNSFRIAKQLPLDIWYEQVRTFNSIILHNDDKLEKLGFSSMKYIFKELFDHSSFNVIHLILSLPKFINDWCVELIVINEYDMCELILNHANWMGSDLERIRGHNSENYGLFHLVVLSLPTENDLTKHWTKARMFLTRMNERQGTLIEQKDAKGRTPLRLFLEISGSMELSVTKVLDFFVYDLKANVNDIEDTRSISRQTLEN